MTTELDFKLETCLEIPEKKSSELIELLIKVWPGSNAINHSVQNYKSGSKHVKLSVSLKIDLVGMKQPVGLWIYAI